MGRLSLTLAWRFRYAVALAAEVASVPVTVKARDFQSLPQPPVEPEKSTEYWSQMPMAEGAWRTTVGDTGWAGGLTVEFAPLEGNH
jgi:hypothetical protein